MSEEQQTDMILGIHLCDDGFYAAGYKNGMSEAEMIPNPDTGDKKWPSVGFAEAQFDSDIFSVSLQKSLDQLFSLLQEDPVSHITFSAGRMSEARVSMLLGVLNGLNLRAAAYNLQEDNESFYDFVTFQNSELWKNEVVFFEERDKKLYAKSLVSAAYPHEKALQVRERSFDAFDFAGEDSETDEAFCALAEQFFEKRLISSVFLQGETFSKSWMKRTIKFLCRGRRVFGVEDLIVKGACYRPLRKPLAEQKTKYYMGTHQLPFHVSMRMSDEDRAEYCRLARAGVNWYDADFSWNFMLNDVDTLHFRTDPAWNEVQRYIDVDVSWIPHRMHLATKAEVRLHFEGKNKWLIQVTDLGLGDLYPSEHKDTIVYLGAWQPS